MKDPLQTSETPYEVLGIEPGLSDEDLRKAYFEAIRKRVPAARATEAYNTLRRPVERARIALTQYDVHALKQLNPCPIDGDPALQVSRRAATAKAWENRLKETFPEPGTIHSLAVQWYWWTQHEEQRYSLIVDAVRDPDSLARGKTGKHSLLRSIARSNGYDCDLENRRNCPNADCAWREDCRTPAPPLEQMWQKVIAYWCALALTPGFWASLDGLTKPQTEELSRSFLDSLHSQILDLAQRYANRFHGSDPGSSKADETSVRWGWGGMTKALQEALARGGITTIGEILRASEATLTGIDGVDLAKAVEIKEYARKMRRRNADLPEEYRMLAQLLRLEERTGEAVTEVGVKRRNGGEVRCGVLMLTSLGYLDAVKNALGAKLIHMQGNPKLQSLQQYLSRYICITLLLDDKRAEAALETIECLSEEERRSNEVRDLRARAHDIMAQQKVSVEKYEDALEYWGEAIYMVSTKSLAEEIRKRMISSCRIPVGAWQRSQPDRIIAILGRALKLVHDPDLQLILGDTLAIQAIERMNIAQRELPEKGMTPELLSRIEEAVANLEKGAELGSKMAQENLAASQQFRESARNGILSLSADALQCVTKATNSAQRQQWDEAIQWFREAEQKAETCVPDELNKSLAACLTNRAVSKGNQAVAAYSRSTAAYEQQIEQFLGAPSDRLGLLGVPLGRLGVCRHCGAGRPRSRLEDWGQTLPGRWAEFNHPKHGTILLCDACAAKLQELLAGRPKPGKDVVDSLHSAAEDLYEAVYLDASGEYPKKSLADLRNLASNLQITLPAQPARRPRKPQRKPHVTAPSPRDGRTDPQEKKPPQTTPATPVRATASSPGQETDTALFTGIVVCVVILIIILLAIALN